MLLLQTELRSRAKVAG
ncbi:unnamed protein product, partial [Allacma fusca]